jgi:hypothetical protein
MKFLKLREDCCRDVFVAIEHVTTLYRTVINKESWTFVADIHGSRLVKETPEDILRAVQAQEPHASGTDVIDVAQWTKYHEKK